MKKIMLLASMLCVSLMHAQEEKAIQGTQETMDAIETTVEYYIQENRNRALPEALKEQQRTNIELSQLPQHIQQENEERLKSNYLRKTFFEKNPSLRDVRGSGKETLINPCEDGTFSSTYGVTKYSALQGDRGVLTTYDDFVAIPIGTNATNSACNNVKPLTLVEPGNDDIVSSYTNTPFLQVNRVKDGSRAIRINQNHEFYYNGPSWCVGQSAEFNEVDILVKRFKAESNTISFDYAAFFERGKLNHGGSDPSDSEYHEHPYFRISVLDITGGGTEIYEEFIRPNDLTREIDIPGDENTRLAYSNWRTRTFNIPDITDRTVELRLEVADCVDTVHAGYAYVDNISNNCPVDPPPYSCSNLNSVEIDIQDAEPGQCTDFLADLHAFDDDNFPNPEDYYIDWYYRLCHVNGGNEVYLGRTGGNSVGRHAVSIFPPTPTGGNTYDDCILIVNAYPVVNGVACTKITETLRLDCSTGGGTGGPKRIGVSPNPSNDVFNISIDAEANIKEVEVRNMQGILINSFNYAVEEINLGNQKPGIYFARFLLDNGEVETKRLLVKE